MALIYLIAGEASGDVLGARLIAALRARRPDLAVAGIGGEAMARAGARKPVPDAGAGADGPAGGAAAAATSSAQAAADGGGYRGAPPRCGGDHRQPRLHAARAEGDPAVGREARPLRRAAGLGLARKPGAALSRPMGSIALPAAIRAGILRPPRPAGDVRRPPGTGERRRSAAMRRGCARDTVSIRRRAW